MKFIYCIVSKQKDYLKIGVSGNPIKRLETIQSHCPLNLQLFHFVLANPDICSPTEGDIKKELKLMGIWNVREWYKFEDLEKIISVMNKNEYKSKRKLSKEKLKLIDELKGVTKMEDMEQNTESWLKNRLEGIGASDAPAVMGRSLYHTKQELWDIKFHKILETEEERQKKEFICNKGHRLEAWARPGIEFTTGLTWRPALFEHQSFPFIRASLDGWNPQVCEFWECKFMGADLFAILSDEKIAVLERIPPQYYDQIMQQFFVTGAKRGRLTGVIEFVENKEERKKQKEAGQEQDKKIITLKSYTLVIERTMEVDEYINKTLAPALFAFWKSVQDGVRPEAEQKDVLKTDNEELITLVKTYGNLVNQKKQLDEQVKKESARILGDIPAQVTKTKASIEGHTARNHGKMDIEGFKLTEKKGKEIIDYTAALEAFFGWIKQVKTLSPGEIVHSVQGFPEEPSLEKYTKAGKPSFAITIPKPKKEEKEVRETHKEMDGKVFDPKPGDELPPQRTPIIPLENKEIDDWKNPITGKMPKGWKTKGDEWRLDYVKKQAKKAIEEQKENFNDIIKLLEPNTHKETIDGVTFES